MLADTNPGAYCCSALSRGVLLAHAQPVPQRDTVGVPCWQPPGTCHGPENMLTPSVTAGRPLPTCPRPANYVPPTLPLPEALSGQPLRQLLLRTDSYSGLLPRPLTSPVTPTVTLSSSISFTPCITWLVCVLPRPLAGLLGEQRPSRLSRCGWSQ